MSSPTKTCFADQDSGALLDLLEKGPRTDLVIELEKHLAECPRCARELASLRQIHALLRHHPGAFHPDEDELYRFVTAQTDPEGTISRHMDGCRDCRDRADLLREMLAIGSEIPPQVPAIPQSLVDRLELIHRSQGQDRVSWSLHRVMGQVRRWLGLPWRVPALAVGTAVAALIVTVMGPQMWTALKEVDRPSGEIAGVAPESPTPTVAPKVEGKVQPAGIVPGGEEYKTKEAPPGLGAPMPDSSPKDSARPSMETRASREPLSKVAPQRQDQLTREFARSPTRSADSPKSEIAPRREAVPAPLAPSKLRMRAPRQAIPSHRDESGLEAQAPHEAEARKKDSPRGMPALGETVGRGSLIPVRVELTDMDGHPVPWLSYSGDPDLAREYSFSVIDSRGKDKSAVKTGAVLNGLVSEQPVAPVVGYRIVIRVIPVGDAYDLEGRLTEVATGKEKGIAVRSRVEKDQAGKEVQTLVRSLLKQR